MICFVCRRLSNSSDGSGVSSTSSLSELRGPDEQERQISGHKPLAVLSEDQDHFYNTLAIDSSMRTSKNSEYSFSGYSNDYIEGQRPAWRPQIFSF